MKLTIAWIGNRYGSKSKLQNLAKEFVLVFSAISAYSAVKSFWVVA
jgi:hypothetical protein